MVTVALLGLFVVVVMDGVASADKSLAALTSETIEDLRTTFQLDPGTRALMNAITNNDVKDLAYNREVFVNHNDLFNGVDTLGGDSVKWLVENSWGTDRGNKGLWSMYDDWFDEYLYTVIIHKRYFPQDVLALLETKPKLLPAWDSMRALLK
jgi:aminopeptidase C